MVAFAIQDLSIIAELSEQDQQRLVRYLIAHLVFDHSKLEVTKLAAWGLANHRMPNAIKAMASEILPSLAQLIECSNIQEFALSILTDVLRSVPDCISLTKLWYKPVFLLLFSDNIEVAKASNDFLNSVSRYLAENDFSESGNTTDVTMYVSLVTDKASENLKMLCAWGHLAIVFGHKLHRTVYLNSLLSLAQANFNSHRPGQRMAAFAAWKRLILNFSFKGHLFHQKRIALIMMPIVNGLKFESSLAVRQSCFDTFLYLLFHLAKAKKSIPNLLTTAVESICFEIKEVKLFSIYLTALSRMVSQGADFTNEDHLDEFELLEKSCEIICQSIACSFDFRSWSFGDLKTLIAVLHSTTLFADNVNVNAIPIWKAMCSFAQNAWETDASDTKAILVMIISFLESNCTKKLISEALIDNWALKLPERDQNENDLTIISIISPMIQNLADMYGIETTQNLKLRSLANSLQFGFIGEVQDILKRPHQDVNSFETRVDDQQVKKLKTNNLESGQDVHMPDLPTSTDQIMKNIPLDKIINIPLDKLDVSELILLQQNITILMSKLTDEFSSRFNSQ